MNTEKDLAAIVGDLNIKINEPMKDHITFKVGGPADYYVTPESVEDLKAVLAYIKENDLPYYLIGNGSNLLVKDKGFRGIVVELLNLNKITVDGDRITAQSGASLKEIAKAALEAGLTGYEFASGIPGSLGGAIRMNAGAYGGEQKMVVESVKVLDENGEEIILKNEDCKFGYRDSIIQHHPYVVLETTFKLEPGDKKAIKDLMDELKEKRESMQPLEYPSAGSTFRRPEGYFVGPLLTDLGFKGKYYGGAQVSDKHAGFVINKNEATAEEVLSLIRMIQKEALDKEGVTLKEEVIIIGE